ncbi:hypothetical protein, partial [Salmonella enterica]|uniref:hypothetical protein n=1 Tax=Salmonella enterica TaxID=28901 RepID=UPI003D2CD318
ILNPSFASKGLSLMSKGDALDKKVAQIDQMQANFLNSAGFHQLSASDQDYLKSMLDNNQNTQRTLLPADKSAFMDYAFGKTSTLQISN